MGRSFAAGRAGTLLEMVYLNAEMNGPHEFLAFDEKRFTYNDLLRHTNQFAAALQNFSFGKHAKIAILLDNSPEFFFSFFGILAAGGVPITISPKSKDNRVLDILQHSDSQAVIAPENYWRSHPVLSDLVRPSGCRMICVEHLAASELIAPLAVTLSDEDFAFFQYTSGTTGSSKGVMITHRAVMANVRAMADRLRIDPETDVCSSMLPLYHDMGLVGFGFLTLYSGARLILYLQDIRNIYSWLDGFAKHGVTISGASNTMIYLTRRVVARPEDYDLSNLRIMLCGSEPLFLPTLRNFESDFNVPRTLVPAYGMAEATLALSMAQPGESFRHDEKGVISCGRPLPQVDLRIHAPDASGVGEVWARTPSLMDGYYKRPDLSRDTLSEGFIRTGDLGYLDDRGELFILGRSKNIIIRDGQNLLPGELEEICLRVPEIRNACVVGVTDTEDNLRESIVLLAEVKSSLLSDIEKLKAIKRNILHLAKDDCNYLPDQILFVPPVTIPFSPNGKMQHQIARKMIQEKTINAAEIIRL